MNFGFLRGKDARKEKSKKGREDLRSAAGPKRATRGIQSHGRECSTLTETRAPQPRQRAGLLWLRARIPTLFIWQILLSNTNDRETATSTSKSRVEIERRFEPACKDRYGNASGAATK